MKDKYNNNIFLVPLLAVLMISIGLINGGTGYNILDAFLFSIAFLMSYVFIFFYRGYDSIFSMPVIVILVLFIVVLSWEISSLLIMPTIVIINFMVLILFTKTKLVDNINEIKSILSFTYNNIPFFNKILFLVSAFFSIYIISK